MVFKQVAAPAVRDAAVEELTQNAFVIRVQPDEGVTLRFGSKVPGAGMEIRDVNMDFVYGGSFTESSPEAYERLILDVLLGDPPLFPRHEEVELSWQILDPILEFWESKGSRSPTRRAAGAPRARTRCWPATDAPGGGHDQMIALTDTDSGRDRRRVHAGPLPRRQPRDGDGADHGRRGRRGRRRHGDGDGPRGLARAPRPGPRRDPRRRPGGLPGRRPGRDRIRLDRRDRADQAQRRGGQAPRLRRAAAAAAGLPRGGLVADRPAGRPGRGPARGARTAADHRLGERVPRQVQGAARPVPRLHAGQH